MRKNHTKNKNGVTGLGQTQKMATKLPLISNNEESPQITSHIPSSVHELGQNAGFSVGVCSEQGKRPYQEDEYVLRPFVGKNSKLETHLFGLFDGHAGGRCSKYISSNIPDVLADDGHFHSSLPHALKRSYHTANDQFLKIAEKMKLHDGSTGLTAVIREGKLIVANVGDCRCLILSGGRPIQMSVDQKPTCIEEQKRISQLGGTVVNCMGVARVNGVLAVSRAFGNRTLKSVIRPDAELTSRDLIPEDDFLVMGSDGLWDVLRNRDVCDVCYGMASHPPAQIAEELVHTALLRGSMDNVTCIVVKFEGYIHRQLEKNQQQQQQQQQQLQQQSSKKGMAEGSPLKAPSFQDILSKVPVRPLYDSVVASSSAMDNGTAGPPTLRTIPSTSSTSSNGSDWNSTSNTANRLRQCSEDSTCGDMDDLNGGDLDSRGMAKANGEALDEFQMAPLMISSNATTASSSVATQRASMLGTRLRDSSPSPTSMTSGGFVGSNVHNNTNGSSGSGIGSTSTRPSLANFSSHSMKFEPGSYSTMTNATASATVAAATANGSSNSNGMTSNAAPSKSLMVHNKIFVHVPSTSSSTSGFGDNDFFHSPSPPPISSPIQTISKRPQSVGGSVAHYRTTNSALTTATTVGTGGLFRPSSNAVSNSMTTGGNGTSNTHGIGLATLSLSNASGSGNNNSNNSNNNNNNNNSNGNGNGNGSSTSTTNNTSFSGLFNRSAPLPLATQGLSSTSQNRPSMAASPINFEYSQRSTTSSLFPDRFFPAPSQGSSNSTTSSGGNAVSGLFNSSTNNSNSGNNGSSSNSSGAYGSTTSFLGNHFRRASPSPHAAAAASSHPSNRT